MCARPDLRCQSDVCHTRAQCDTHLKGYKFQKISRHERDFRSACQQVYAFLNLIRDLGRKPIGIQCKKHACVGALCFMSVSAQSPLRKRADHTTSNMSHCRM